MLFQTCITCILFWHYSFALTVPLTFVHIFFDILSQVQGTNDSSVVSKVSAAAQGYFHDDFLKHFVCKVSRRAPLINR